MIDFRPTAPALGTVVMLDDQAYQLTGVEPYTRKDGLQSNVLTWTAGCAECGESFKTKTGLKATWLHRRCEAHRQLGKPVTKRGSKVTVRIIEPSQEQAQ